MSTKQQLHITKLGAILEDVLKLALGGDDGVVCGSLHLTQRTKNVAMHGGGVGVQPSHTIPILHKQLGQKVYDDVRDAIPIPGIGPGTEKWFGNKFFTTHHRCKGDGEVALVLLLRVGVEWRDTVSLGMS